MKLSLPGSGEVFELYKMTFGQAEDLIDAISLDSLDFKTKNELKQAIINILPDVSRKVSRLIFLMFGIPIEKLNCELDELADVLAEMSLYVLGELSQLKNSSEKHDEHEGNGNVPLFFMFFDLQLSLCERFTSLTPFYIREQNLHDVLSILKRLNENVRSDKVIDKTDIIRRPAKDDSWY